MLYLDVTHPPPYYPFTHPMMGEDDNIEKRPYNIIPTCYDILKIVKCLKVER
jgi:hypothetical protein